MDRGTWWATVRGVEKTWELVVGRVSCLSVRLVIPAKAWAVLLPQMLFHHQG